MTTRKIDVFNSRIKIPFFAPDITNEDKDAVAKALNSSLLISFIVPLIRLFSFKKFSLTGRKILTC